MKLYIVGVHTIPLLATPQTDPNAILVVVLSLRVSQQSILAISPRDPIVPFSAD